MKVSELRLGNYILHNGEVMPVVQIERRFKTMFRLNDMDVDERIIEDHFQPIPLTPEWLGRCGFKKQMYRYYGDPKSEAVEAFVKDRFVIRFINLIDRKGYRAEWIPYEQSQNGLPGWIDYVHQLQNKYYFWTDGEELTINNEHLQSTS